MYFYKVITIFGLFFFTSVQSISEKIGHSGSELDISGTAKSVFSNLLSGKNSLDPISLNDIDVQIKKLHIKLNNIKVSKLNTCTAEESLYPKKSTYDYDLKCTELVLTADADIKGCLGIIDINGNDSITVTAKDYEIKVKGEYGFFTPEGADSKRFYLKDVIKMENKAGKIEYKTENDFGLSKIQVIIVKLYHLKKDNKELFEKDLKKPIMDDLTTKLLSAIDGYIKSVSAKDLLQKSKEVCDFDDEECLTRGMKGFFTTLRHGVKGLLEPIEPMKIDNASGDIPGFKFQITNATFSTLRYCVPELRFLKTEPVYDYALRCSKLFLTANVMAKGRLGPFEIDGSDTVSLVANDYVVKALGGYGIFTAEEDQSQRFFLKEFTMDTEPQGMITMTTGNMFGISPSERDPVIKYFKENWKTLEKDLRYPIMYLFMSNLVKAGDVYLRATPMADVFPKKEV